MSSTCLEHSSYTEVLNKDDIFIAVMGLSGAGKSSLIASCTGQEVEIGHTLSSCTTSVCMYSFNHYGSTGTVTRVHLVDTPGFNDPRRTNMQILQELVYWLSQAYDKDFLLDGIVYLHNILAPRFEGATRQSFEIMRAMVGEDNYNCVYLAATFWDEALHRGISDFTKASRNHDELEDEFWKPMIDRGAQMCLPPEDEIDEPIGYSWANKMIEYFVRKAKKHELRIQTELLTPNLRISETTAGRLAETVWEEDMACQTGGLQLQKTKEQLTKEWSDCVRRDMLLYKQEIDSLNRRITQHTASIVSPSHHAQPPPNQSYIDYYNLLRQQKGDLERQQMLRLTSYGYRLNVATAAFGFGSLVTGGISAFAALGACTVM